MAEDNTPAEAPAQPTSPGIRILAQYIRDLSFENPRAPAVSRCGASRPAAGLQNHSRRAPARTRRLTFRPMARVFFTALSARAGAL